ncbi:putative leucine-rich repeat-containing protein DDB_G0290503 isoform X1 [Bombyx mori]|uniref:Protein PAT1 homolog 1 n=1 Tax=Bombyx mori TaxID=7091 RepID=A0A8R1WN01_BOMMO|nr:putative leucine-rich repeat-containing protein DDB_G0290503 isoform X1 [Bombyx mori]
MADSFFGFDTSLSNLNDDEGCAEPSEDEYDALNDETFGHGSDEYDWEVEHEHLAGQLESSRRQNSGIDEIANSQLELSLSQLVLDDTDAPQSGSLGSSVWRNDAPFPGPQAPAPLKNVCTVEELERQLRHAQSQPMQQHSSQQPYNSQNYYQPRFPVILQRPPGLQAPVLVPFVSQQHNMNQPMNTMLSQNNQIPQNNQMMSNQMGQNQFMQNNQIGQFQNSQMGTNLGPNVHQMRQNMKMNQMGPKKPMPQNLNQMSQNVNQMPKNMTQMGQNIAQPHPQINQNIPQMNPNINQMNLSQMPHNYNHMNQNSSQMGPSMNQIGPNTNHMGPGIGQISQPINKLGSNVNQMTPNMNQNSNHINQMIPNLNKMPPNSQLAQNSNQLSSNTKPMGQNVNQMMNGNQFGQMNQFPHMMGQPRMMGPPPGINMPRQNYNQQNVGQFNSNIRGPTLKNESQQVPTQQYNQIANKMSQPAKSVSPQRLKKTETKQKTRIYNNTNLSSQNLVQIIQNTHPILQYNSGFHNASHHPMLGRGPLNNQLNHPLLNQRQNGTYSNRESSQDEEVANEDEYAGLMSQREKQWLLNIQMLQLNTGTPYIHDYYYTVFLERQANKEKEGVKEAHKANQQNHPFYSGTVKQDGHQHRERHNSNRHNSTGEEAGAPRAYVPTQFENSLGKLQCGSVTAPRKLIDVEVVGGEVAPSRMSRASSVASTANPAEAPREMKRTKQLLLDIEALYLILLRLEELNDPLAISNALILKEREEKQKLLDVAQKELNKEDDDDSNLFLKNIESVQRRPKQESPKNESIDKRQVVNLAVAQKPAPVNLLDENKDDLISKMFAGLLHADRVAQMMNVRKGRMLISRFVRRVGPSHPRLRTLWGRLLRALTVARRHDPTVDLATPYAEYIQSTTGWSAVLESCSVLSEALDPARTPHALSSSFTLSAICALVLKASTLVSTGEPSAGERQWAKFLRTAARALRAAPPGPRPLRPLPEPRLRRHLRQLEARGPVEILQRGQAPNLVDMTKQEMHELLVKHLC